MSIAKDAIENSNFRLQTVLNSAQVGVFEYDVIAKRHLYLNEQWPEIFGYKQDDIVNTAVNIMLWYENRIHKDDFEDRMRLYEKLLLGKIDDFGIELRVLDSMDNYKWVKCFCSAIKDPETGYVKKIVHTLLDISNEKNKMIEVESLKNKLTNAATMAKVGTWELDVQKEEVWWSDETYSIFGVEKSTTIDLPLVESIIHKDDVANHKRELENALANGVGFTLEYRINVNNKVKYIWAKGSIIKQNNKVTKLVGAVQDITERREKNELLINSKSYINRIMHTSLNGMYIFDFKENKNIYLNDQYTNITGYTLKDLETTYKDDFMSLFHKDFQEDVIKHMEEVAKSKIDEVIEIKYKLRHKTGKYIWCLSRDVISTRDENGNPLEMIGSFLDITDYHDECQ